MNSAKQRLLKLAGLLPRNNKEFNINKPPPSNSNSNFNYRRLKNTIRKRAESAPLLHVNNSNNTVTRPRAISDPTPRSNRNKTLNLNTSVIDTIKNEIKALKTPLLNIRLMTSRNYQQSLKNTSLTGNKTYNNVKNIISNKPQSLKEIVTKRKFEFSQKYLDLLALFDNIDNVSTIPELVEHSKIILDKLYSLSQDIPNINTTKNAKTRILNRLYTALKAKIDDTKMQIKRIFSSHNIEFEFNSKKYNNITIKTQF